MANILTFVRDGLASAIAGLGTERDKAASVYYTEPTIDAQQLVAAYRGSWLPRKIVDIPALDSCRAWRSWQAKNEQIEKIEDEEARLGVQAKVLEARKKARLFGGAALYFDLGDDASQPLDVEKVKAGGIRFLTVLTPRQLQPGEIETDPLSPLYGRPRDYTIVNGMSAQPTVHPSRMAIFIGNEMPDKDITSGSTFAWGDSILTSVMEAVKQADATSANIASLIFEANVDVVTMEGLMAHVGTPEGERKVTERYRIAATGKSINRMLILDGKEKYERKSASFQTLPDLMDRFFQNVSGAADIPMTRLFGQSPGGLNASGESDLRNYYDRIASGQSLEMQPAMANLDECLIRSALGQRDANIHYVWNPLWQMSEKDKAEIFEKKSNAARTIAGKGQESPLMPIDVISEAFTNELIEDGTLAGLEAALKKYGTLAEQEDDENDRAAAVTPTKVANKEINDFDPSQPREPAGTPGGGQWTSGGGSGARRDHSKEAKPSTADDLTEEQKAAIKDYTSADYGDINRYLRNESYPGTDLEQVRAMIGALDGALSKASLPEPVTVYRGFSGDAAAQLRAANLKPGDIIEDAAFLSTTRNKDYASMRLRRRLPGIVMKIEAPKGARGVDVESISFMPSEKEVLFARGSRLRVTKWAAAADQFEVEIV